MIQTARILASKPDTPGGIHSQRPDEKYDLCGESMS